MKISLYSYSVTSLLYIYYQYLYSTFCQQINFINFLANVVYSHSNLYVDYKHSINYTGNIHIIYNIAYDYKQLVDSCSLYNFFTQHNQLVGLALRKKYFFSSFYLKVQKMDANFLQRLKERGHVIVDNVALKHARYLSQKYYKRIYYYITAAAQHAHATPLVDWQTINFSVRFNNLFFLRMQQHFIAKYTYCQLKWYSSMQHYIFSKKKNNIYTRAYIRVTPLKTFLNNSQIMHINAIPCLNNLNIIQRILILRCNKQNKRVAHTRFKDKKKKKFIFLKTYIKAIFNKYWTLINMKNNHNQFTQGNQSCVASKQHNYNYSTSSYNNAIGNQVYYSRLLLQFIGVHSSSAHILCSSYARDICLLAKQRHNMFRTHQEDTRYYATREIIQYMHGKILRIRAKQIFLKTLNDAGARYIFSNIKSSTHLSIIRHYQRLLLQLCIKYNLKNIKIAVLCKLLLFLRVFWLKKRAIFYKTVTVEQLFKLLTNIILINKNKYRNRKITIFHKRISTIVLLQKTLKQNQLNMTATQHYNLYRLLDIITTVFNRHKIYMFNKSFTSIISNLSTSASLFYYFIQYNMFNKNIFKYAMHILQNLASPFYFTKARRNVTDTDKDALVNPRLRTHIKFTRGNRALYANKSFFTANLATGFEYIARVPLRLIKLAGHYLPMWRRLRQSFREARVLRNIQRQHRLTKYIARLCRDTRFWSLQLTELMLFFVLIRSKLSMFKHIAILFIQLGYVYINGTVCNLPTFNVQGGDIIQVIYTAETFLYNEIVQQSYLQQHLQHIFYFLKRKKHKRAQQHGQLAYERIRHKNYLRRLRTKYGHHVMTKFSLFGEQTFLYKPSYAHIQAKRAYIRWNKFYKQLIRPVNTFMRRVYFLRQINQFMKLDNRTVVQNKEHPYNIQRLGIDVSNKRQYFFKFSVQKILDTTLFFCDIPAYMEVDYISLSIVIIYTPTNIQEMHKTTLFFSGYGLGKMLNWKYIT